jgi:hypothetical protein
MKLFDCGSDDSASLSARSCGGRGWGVGGDVE